MAHPQVIFGLIASFIASSAAEYYLGKQIKPQLHKIENVKDYEDNQPNYKYAYQVNDQYTGDFKNHHETREGDVVKGYYSVQEADGTLREVHYTSDKFNGFNAVVRKSGTPTPEPETFANNHKYGSQQNRHLPQTYKKPNFHQKRQESIQIEHYVPGSEDYKQNQQPIAVYSLEDN